MTSRSPSPRSAKPEDRVESKSTWSWFEKTALLLASVIFLGSLAMYVSHFPLRRYLFGVLDEGADVRIGQTQMVSGDIKRQRIGTGEFVSIANEAG